MSKKIIIGAVFVIGLAVAYSFGGQVPAKPAHTSGVVTDAHAKVHLGQMYRTGHYYPAVAAAATAYFLVDVATTSFTADEIHTNILITVESSSLLVVYRDPVVSSSGTLVDSYNLNHPIADAATALFYHTPTITSLGTIVQPHIFIPAGKFNTGTDIKNNAEYVGATGEMYLICVVNKNGQAASDIGIYADFYEQIQP